jgi:hypothetical protein
MGKKHPLFPSNHHPCHHPGCPAQVRDKRSDGKHFSCCYKHRRPAKNVKKQRTDVSNPLRMSDVIDCPRLCGWRGTLWEFAWEVDGKPPHRREHNW